MAQPGDYIKMNLRDFNGAMPYRIITSQRITCNDGNGASSQSAAFDPSTVAVMIGAVMQGSSDLGVCFKFGSNPTATLTDPILPGLVGTSSNANTGQYLTFKVNPGDKAAFKPSKSFDGGSTSQQIVVIIELGY